MISLQLEKTDLISESIIPFAIIEKIIKSDIVSIYGDTGNLDNEEGVIYLETDIDNNKKAIFESGKYQKIIKWTTKEELVEFVERFL